MVTLDFGVTNGSHWYLDGVDLGSFTAPNRSIDPNGVRIAGTTVFASNYFTGALDEIRFSKTLPSSDWIATQINIH
jgi:hypothetical protein